MEFVFGIEEVRVLARQHAAGCPGGAKGDFDNLLGILGELAGCPERRGGARPAGRGREMGARTPVPRGRTPLAPPRVGISA